MKKLIYIVCLFTFFASCSGVEDFESADNKNVVLTFPITSSENMVTMGRSVVSADNSIRTIDLLIFDSAKKFKERIEINNISSNGSSATFQVRLAASEQAHTIHVIANGRDENNRDVANFSAISSGLEEAKAITLLQTNAMSVAKALAAPLLMTGKVALPNIRTSTRVGNINMVRSVASIYVECKATMTNASDFELTGVTLLKSAQLGQVIPNHDTSVSAPTNVSVPSGLKYIDYVNVDGMGIWARPINTSRTSELYLYERANTLDNSGLSVIVSGKYKGVEGYYKIWLQDNAGKAINIVRNHCYQVQISKVSGVGYPSLKDAIVANHSANIFSNIVDDNDDITDIVTDSKYELGISSNAVQVSGNGRQVIATILNTNLELEAKVTTTATWLTDLKLEGTGVRRTLTANLASTTASRKATIVVRAGSLEKKIELTQQISSGR